MLNASSSLELDFLLKTMDFEQAYPKIYPGWDRTAAAADFRLYGQKKVSEYLARQQPSTSSYSSSPTTSTFDMAGYLAGQKAEGERLRTKQAAEEEALFKTFQAKSAAQPKLTDIYSGLLQEKGITGLETKQTDILNMIDALNKDVTARTAGTLTSEAQRRRMYAAELQPLSESLTPISRSLATGREDVATQLQLRSAEQTKELETDRMRIAATSDRFARESTGYTQDRQDSLTLLLNKLQSDQQLSEREWTATQDLAKSEREWENTKKKLEIENINAIKLKQTLEPKAGTSTISNPYLVPGITSTLGTTGTTKTWDDWNNLGSFSTFGDVMKYYG